MHLFYLFMEIIQIMILITAFLLMILISLLFVLSLAPRKEEEKVKEDIKRIKEQIKSV